MLLFFFFTIIFTKTTSTIPSFFLFFSKFIYVFFFFYFPEVFDILFINFINLLFAIISRRFYHNWTIHHWLDFEDIGIQGSFWKVLVGIHSLICFKLFDFSHSKDLLAFFLSFDSNFLKLNLFIMKHIRVKYLQFLSIHEGTCNWSLVLNVAAFDETH